MTRIVSLCLALALCITPIFGQQASRANSESSAVPMLSKFNGILTDINNQPIINISGVTFSLYAEAEGGAALWIETQNVQPDKNGRYTVTLGSTKSTGLPEDVFASGQARWLGVQASGQAEYPRILLMSVPYALKAADAATIGGLPPSAFVRSNPDTNSATSGVEEMAPASTGNAQGGSKDGPPVTYSAVETPTKPGGKVGYLPLWTTAPNIVGNSNLFQSTTGSTSGFFGIGTNAPATLLQLSASVPRALGPTLTLMDPAGGAGAGGSVDFDGYNPGSNAPAARIQSLDDGNYSASLNFSTKNPGAANNPLVSRPGNT